MKTSRPVVCLQHLATLLLTCFCFVSASEVRAQTGEPTKYRLRVQEVDATTALKSSTSGSARKSLDQIVDACDEQLLNAVEQTRKFELVARDPNAVIREQDFAASGNIDSLDPQAAQQFKMAGVKYIAMVTVDNFQDVTRRMTLEGGLGKTEAERRTIQIQAVVRVVDATRATVLRSTNVTFEKAAVDEIIAGSTSEGGRKTDALIGQVSNELATRAANAITDMLYPAKIIGYTNGVITFNRTKSSGAAKGPKCTGMAGSTFSPGLLYCPRSAMKVSRGSRRSLKIREVAMASSAAATATRASSQARRGTESDSSAGCASRRR